MIFLNYFMSIVPEEKENHQGDLTDPNTNEQFRGKGDLVDPENQTKMSQMLNRSRRQAGNDGIDRKKNIENLAKAATSGQAGLIKEALKLGRSMWKQTDFSRDWPYVFILIPMSALKDIVDIAFAAIPGVGIVVSFIFTILIAILTATFLVLITGKFTSKRAMLNIAGPLIQFFTEAFPGIGWLPLCFVETVLIYLIVLGQRAVAFEGQPEASEQPEPQAV